MLLARVTRGTTSAHRGQGFGDLVFRRERSIPGVVLIRIASETAVLKTTRLLSAIERYGEALFVRYTVVEEGRFRSRHLWSER
jgi:hypothetical protein